MPANREVWVKPAINCRDERAIAGMNGWILRLLVDHPLLLKVFHQTEQIGANDERQKGNSRQRDPH